MCTPTITTPSLLLPPYRRYLNLLPASSTHLGTQLCLTSLSPGSVPHVLLWSLHSTLPSTVAHHYLPAAEEEVHAGGVQSVRASQAAGPVGEDPSAHDRTKQQQADNAQLGGSVSITLKCLSQVPSACAKPSL